MEVSAFSEGFLSSSFLLHCILFFKDGIIRFICIKNNKKTVLFLLSVNMGMGMAAAGGSGGLGNYLSQEFLLQTARNLRMQNPEMPQEVLQMHLQRIIMMQIRQKQEEQRRVGTVPHLEQYREKIKFGNAPSLKSGCAKRSRKTLLLIGP